MTLWLITYNRKINISHIVENIPKYMKKIFETNDKRESNFLKNHLNDKYYESEIRNTSGKYELFISVKKMTIRA